MRNRRGQGRGHRTPRWRLPRSGGCHAAARGACRLRPGRSDAHQRHGPGWGGEGRGRRSRRDAWRPDPRHRHSRRTWERRCVSRRTRRGHGHALRSAHSAGRACDQSRAARDDPGGAGQGRCRARHRLRFRRRGFHPRREGIGRAYAEPSTWDRGGLSILGTTRVVVPYSWAAWIAGIQQGIDVARASGITHIAGATGRTSEAAVQALHALPDIALIDMGDFAGGMLKYLRAHPVSCVTIAGGVAKITKLAQGRLDLHSRRGEANMAALAMLAGQIGANPETQARTAAANTVAEEIHRRRIDDARARRAVIQKRPRHERSRVKTHRAARHQVTPRTVMGRRHPVRRR
jgi:hypothetical protein